MTRWYRIGLRLIGQLLLVVVIAGGILSGFAVRNVAAAAPSAPNASALLYQVVDADNAHDGGVYYRRSPHWNDTSRTPGVGPYYGETVRLQCYATGDPVGPYQNRVWHYVTDISRPSAGAGWISDHYLNTPVVANQLVPGEPQCQTAPVPVTLPVSVFFSGTYDPTGGTGHQVATQDIGLSDLQQPNCSPAVIAKVINGVITLAAWSKGRDGVIFFLAHASPAEIAAVQRIVLIDPGNSSDFAASCDTRYNDNALFANWLSQPGHQLLILTGRASEEKPLFGRFGSATFKGLRQYYLADIVNQPFAGRALICDYDMADHKQIMQDAWSIVQHPHDGCPILSREARPVAYTPNTL